VAFIRSFKDEPPDSIGFRFSHGVDPSENDLTTPFLSLTPEIVEGRVVFKVRQPEGKTLRRINEGQLWQQSLKDRYFRGETTDVLEATMVKTDDI
jgi:hypothetical protein